MFYTAEGCMHKKKGTGQDLASFSGTAESWTMRNTLQ